MPSYATLDTIADFYTPLLALAALAFIVIALFKSQWRLAGQRLLTLTAALSVAYGLMFFDKHFKLWSSFGLDYSTHTAVALVLVVFLATNAPKLTTLWLVSLLAYALLMLYQGYHTVSDIVVTGTVVIIPVWLVLAYFYQRWPFAAANMLLSREAQKRHDS